MMTTLSTTVSRRLGLRSPRSRVANVGWAQLLLLALLTATPAGAEELVCVPGQEIACACKSGDSGAQRCAGDGRSFEPCVCEDAAPPEVPAPTPAPTPTPAPAPRPVATADGGGLLEVTAVRPGTVVLDGGVVGRTPLLLPGVAPGNHELKVLFDGGGDRKQRVTVLGGQRTTVHVTLSRAREVAEHREGLRVGVSVSGHGGAAVGVGPGGFGEGGVFGNYGLVPAVDLRFGLQLMVGAYRDVALVPRVPLHVRFNLGSIYSMVLGATGGVWTQPEIPHAQWFVGPELSLASFRLGSERQLELTLMQHVFATHGTVVAKDRGGGAVWVLHNSLQLAYLFL